MNTRSVDRAWDRLATRSQFHGTEFKVYNKNQYRSQYSASPHVRHTVICIGKHTRIIYLRTIVLNPSYNVIIQTEARHLAQGRSVGV